MSKVVSKGHLIDDYCKHTSGDLVDVSGDVYTCMLNQTDIKSNKNKYYVIQLINEGSDYILFTRYGRIGESGRAVYKNLT